MPSREPNAIDRLFLRFQVTGDPSCLAAVFDRCAPELLRIAVRLSGGVAAGEDLVQATFVEAIEHRNRWDRTRSVLPWLVGILGNLARRARREPRGSDLSEDSRESSDDPVAAAERAELERELDQALESLAEPFREVVVLHVRHGLTAAEIADALDRPAGTVRTQVVRGLDRLRRALPLGLASSIATTGVGIAAEARGIEVVRVAVLEVAGARAPATPVVGWQAFLPSWLVVIGMKKLAMGVAAAAVLALAFLLTAPPNAGHPAASGQPSTPALASAKGDLSTSEADGRRRRTVLASDEVAPRGLEVRVRYARDDSPATGVRVDVVDGRGLEWNVVTSVFANDQGIARFPEQMGTVLLRTDRGTRVTTVHEAVAPGMTALSLPPGLTLRGRVVDAAGQGVPEARIVVHAGDFHGPRVLGVTDAGGNFEVRDVEAMRIEVWAAAAGYARSTAREFFGGLGADYELDLALGATPARIEGEFLGRDGAPVGSAPVYIVVRSDGEAEVLRDWATRTDTEGRFTVADLPVGRLDVYAGNADTGVAFAAVETAPSAVLPLRLQPGGAAGFTGRILDQAGRPHDGLFVIASWAGPEVGNRNDTYLGLWGSTEPDGSYCVENLLPGRYRLQIGTNHRRVETTVEVGAGEVHEWSPAFARGRELRIEIVDDNGDPRPHWVAALGVWIDGPGGPTWQVRRAGAANEDGRVLLTDLRDDVGELAFLEPLGRSSMFGPSGRFPCLRIEGVDVRAGKLRVEVPEDVRPRGRVRGRILDPDGEPIAGADVRLRRDDWHADVSVSTVLDGTFSLGRLPEGAYELHVLRHPDAPFDRIGAFDLEAAGEHDVGQIRLGRLARVSVSVVDGDGNLVSGLDVRLRPGDASESGRRVKAVAPGIYHSGLLRAGNWKLELRRGESLVHAEDVSAVPGAPSELRVALDG